MKARQIKRFIITALIGTAFISGCGNNLSGQDLLNQSSAEREEAQRRAAEEGTEKPSLGESISAGFSNLKETVVNAVNGVRDNNSNKRSEKDSAKTSSSPSPFVEVELPKDAYLFVSTDSGFTAEEKKNATHEFVRLSKLDTLGRVGYGIGVFSRGSLKSNGRDDISNITPTGWEQAYYDKAVTGSDHEALYDRCHIIMEALSDSSEENNLFTGTRQCNLAMLEWETKVTDFLYKNPGYSVLFKVSPDFRGNDLVCRGVSMQAYSIEDKGSGLSFTVYVYNKEQGISIDYATGKSWLTQEVNK